MNIQLTVTHICTDEHDQQTVTQICKDEHDQLSDIQLRADEHNTDMMNTWTWLTD